VGLAYLTTAHRHDSQLHACVVAFAASVADSGPLSATERALVAALVSRIDQARHATSLHADKLRAATGDEQLVRAVLDDPQALCTSWPDPRLRMLAELAHSVTTGPWTLSRKQLSRAYTASLSDEDVLHLVALAAYVGHVDRLSDRVDVPLDAERTLEPYRADTAAQVFSSAPKLVVGRPAIDPSRRPVTQAALAEWRTYAFYRDTPISRRTRTLVARWVAMWLGDGGISPPTDLTGNPHDDAFRAFAETITLAPWTVDDGTLAPLRDNGFDDAAILDATATITSAGVFSRIEVALAALAS